MKNPDKLEVVSLAEDLAVETYGVTRAFPKSELYGLVSQMRRASLSIASTIVEGCGQLGDRAFVAYLHRSVGSGNELNFQARVSTRLEFGGRHALAMLRDHEEIVRRKLIRLIMALR